MNDIDELYESSRSLICCIDVFIYIIHLLLKEYHVSLKNIQLFFEQVVSLWPCLPLEQFSVLWVAFLCRLDF